MHLGVNVTHIFIQTLVPTPIPFFRDKTFDITWLNRMKPGVGTRDTLGRLFVVSAISVSLLSSMGASVLDCDTDKSKRGGGVLGASLPL